MTDFLHQAWPSDTRQLRVGELLVDLRYRRVSRPDGDVELPHRMFELLQLFLAEPHVLHSRAELFERVWPSVIVEDANLSQSIWMLRKALGPDRKDWIRTIAKRGYVFEPPVPVEIVAEPDAADALGAAPADADADATSTRAHRPRWRTSLRWATAALLVATLARSMLPVPAVEGRGPVVPEMAVVLMKVEDQDAPADQRWATALLSDWIDWKLSHVPELTLLSEADLAVNASTLTPKVVLLASGQVPGQPGEFYLRAKFDNHHGGLIEMRGPAAEIPAMTDALSQQVIARLLPHRADERWPALALDAANARRFTEVAAAYRRRDWIAVTVGARAVSRQAPQFGPARIYLALALAKLAQAAPAIDQMATARAMLKPLPADAVTVLDALQLSIDPQRFVQAAAAYEALAQRYPGRAGFALEQARLLGFSGRLREARAIVTRPGFDRQPVGLRVTRLLRLAEIDLMLGDPEATTASALEAERLIRASGERWKLELGNALLLRAEADRVQRRHEADFGLYELAARAFEAGGAGTDALFARVLGETARPPGGRKQGFEELLAKAREGGYRRVEIELLRRVAFQHYNAGQMPEYRRRLEQALDAAIEAGDTVAQQILDLDLLNEDQLRGDFAGAEKRLQRLRRSGLQGDAAAWVDQFDAYLAATRGRFGAALASLARAEQRSAANDGAIPPMAAARMACARAQLLLAQGDLPGARADVERCGSAKETFTRMEAVQGRIGVELMAGNTEAARGHLDEAMRQLADIPEGPDRWLYSIQAAFLATRARDFDRAEQLYSRVLPTVRSAGYGWLSAAIETGRAELAAARGDWAASQRHAATARMGLPADSWVLSSRLDAVGVVAALAAGQRALAFARLSDIDGQAHRLGDVATQLELHSLMSPSAVLPPCNHASRLALAASTALNGATLSWLTGGLANQAVLSQQDRTH